MISVILPNFNHAEYLPDCLHGLLTQTYGDLEILVVDDGSSDDSPAVITAFAAEHPEIVPLLQSRNAGALKAIDIAMSRARGDLIFGAASDDFLSNPEFFAQAVAALTKYPRAAIAFGRARMIDGMTDAPLRAFGRSVASGYVGPQAAMQGFLTGMLVIPGASAVLRRSAINELGGFDPAFGPQSDYFVNHAAAARHGAVFLDEIMATVRVFPTSFSASTRSAFLERHQLLEQRIASLDLPYAIDPAWLAAFRRDVTLRALTI